ncbi:hypothetical protein BDZ45DRAFT_766151 [Acephala macrosclerotiorum]|nr:hypothetical protein BDZ45DRAFT_766151 [Acephala macrosclerotiorum]
MLEEFETIVEKRYEEMEKANKAFNFLRFNRSERNVRCFLTTVKSEFNARRSHYAWTIKRAMGFTNGALIKIKKLLRTVLQFQEWNAFVREHLTPTNKDWTMLKQIAIFFNIFRRPTIQTQTEKYPTLHNTILDYLHMLRQLRIFQAQDDKPFLQSAATAGYKVLEEYYKKSLATRHSFVALICDFRYKFNYVSYMYDNEGRVNATQYKKAKAHFEHVYN